MDNKVLVTLKGNPIITVGDLIVEREKFLSENPRLRQALAYMNAQEIDRNILEGLISQKLVAQYIADHNITQADFFREGQAITLSDDEVKSFYEEHKDAIPALHVPQDQITGPQDSKYVPYDDIKDRLKDELEENKRIEFFAKKIDVLKKEYDVVVDETHFR